MKKTLVAVVLAMVITSLIYVIINKEAKDEDFNLPTHEIEDDNTEEVSNEVEKNTVILDLHEGYVARTISINPESGVGGFILPDTYVDIYVGKKEDDGKEPITEVLLTDIRVLAVDTIYYKPESNEENTEAQQDTEAQPIVASNITMELTEEDALEIFKYKLDAYSFVLVLKPQKVEEEADEEVEEEVEEVDVTNEDDNQSS